MDEHRCGQHQKMARFDVVAMKDGLDEVRRVVEAVDRSAAMMKLQATLFKAGMVDADELEYYAEPF